MFKQEEMMNGSKVVCSLEQLLIQLMQQGITFDELRSGVQTWVGEYGQFPCLTRVVSGEIVVAYAARGTAEGTTQVRAQVLPTYCHRLPPASDW